MLKLQSVFNKLKPESVKKRVLIATDCNIDLLNTLCGHGDTSESQQPKATNPYRHSSSNKLIDILQSFGYEANFDLPTRETDQSSTCIDNIITNMKYTEKKICILDPALSDHKALFITLPDNLEIKKENTKRNYKVRDYSEENIQTFKYLIGLTHWPDLLSSDSASENYDNFLRHIISLFDYVMPLTSKRVSRKHECIPLKWITPGIKTSSKQKRFLHAKAKTSNNPNDQIYYKKYRKVLEKVIKAAKKNFK
jgi:hypothetical protein